ncbi:RimK family alpha-L-glutamate ligase [Lyticum sinuosum]|uniref:Ribosomal protein S6 modification protein n=1 Tax=Lyticum sinuosum TaxID=1332059 RepID=A0AAE4VM29_9RICK|nr:RimK family alpha-L-glutamate ligase [Lyticum sinuosum]MDZ5761064.1 Ribosomal protein S6 modification protein [Lyticum sinuosum]
MLNKIIVGCEEWCSLPDIGIMAIKAKIDSGALTSSINAHNISVEIDNDGTEYAHFDINPIQYNQSLKIKCRSQIICRRIIKSSNGISEKRIIILVNVSMAGKKWPIELSLANRSNMEYRMLLGREAMEKFFIDMSRKFILGNISIKKIHRMYKSKINHNLNNKKKLKVILLASNPHLYSNKRIIEAFKIRGHNILFVDVSKCYIKICSDGMYVFYNGDQLNNVDIVIPRFRPSVTFFGCSLLRQFNAMGVYCLNSDEAVANARNKLKALQILAKKGVKIPVSAFANSPLDTQHLIDIVDGTPLILKLLEGTQGKGVVLIDTHKSAKSVMDAFKSIKASVILQRFVKEANGEDIRCFVIGGKIVASMKRQANIDDFRSNLHLGGKALSVKLTKDEISMAKLASKSLGMQISGVDIVRSKNGSQVIEVNSSPGLEGIEKITGLDIAGMIVDYVEKDIAYRAK